MKPYLNKLVNEAKASGYYEVILSARTDNDGGQFLQCNTGSFYVKEYQTAGSKHIAGDLS
jgi:hypothetical protein